MSHTSNTIVVKETMQTAGIESLEEKHEWTEHRTRPAGFVPPSQEMLAEDHTARCMRQESRKSRWTAVSLRLDTVKG